MNKHPLFHITLCLTLLYGAVTCHRTGEFLYRIEAEHIDEVFVLSKLPPNCWLLVCSYTVTEICLKVLA